jgi:hypothetical protein
MPYLILARSIYCGIMRAPDKRSSNQGFDQVVVKSRFEQVCPQGWPKKFTKTACQIDPDAYNTRPPSHEG